MEIKERVSFLRNVSIFSETDEELLSEIGQHLELMNFTIGQTIFHKGDDFDGMYFIRSGQVKVHDEDYIFTYLGENEFFGEYSLIDSEVRSASVTTTQDSKLYKMDHDTLYHLMHERVEITRGLLKSLILRLRENNVLEEKLALQKDEIEEQKEALDAQRRELKELNATKDKFLAILAHDLRNPASSIVGMAEILKENLDELSRDEMKKYLNQLFHQSRNLLNLLKDLLQWAKSQAKLSAFKPEKVLLKEILDQNILSFKETITLKNIKLIKEYGHAGYVTCDQNMINTVIRNLLSNALKFTPTNGEITVSAEKKEAEVIVSLQDSGIGISEADQKKLFRIEENASHIGYEEKEAMLTPEDKGTGIGLILCQELIRKHGGKIWVRSSPGNGSTFYFSIPASKA